MGRAESLLRGRIMFLVGARRSGTNWLQALLGTHPQIATVASETHLLYAIAELEPQFQHGLISSPTTGQIYLPRAEMLDGFRDLCDRAFVIQLAAAGPDVILLERSPWHALRLDLVVEIYPEAHVIHLIRDGRDVAGSLVRQSWGPPSLGAAAAEWVETVTRARAAAPVNYHEVRYEDMVADPAGGMAELFAAIGLPVDDEQLAAVRQVADRPINVSEGGIGRTGWQHLLGPDQVAEIETVAGPLLRELGYPLADPASVEQSGSSRPAPTRAAGRGSRARAGWRRIRVRRAASPPADRPPTLGAALADRQIVVDQLIAALEDRDAEGLEAIISPEIEITLPATGEVVRGSAGADRVVRALLEQLAPSGRQVMGHTYPGRPNYTVVCGYEADGQVVQHVYVVRVDAGLVTKLRYYRRAGTAT